MAECQSSLNLYLNMERPWAMLIFFFPKATALKFTEATFNCWMGATVDHDSNILAFTVSANVFSWTSSVLESVKTEMDKKKKKKSKASQVLRSQLSVSLKILHPLPLFYYLVISRHVKLSVHNGKNNRVCNLQRFLLVPLRAALPNKLLVLWLYLLFSQEEQG